MSKKTESVASLIKLVKCRWPLPTRTPKVEGLLEKGVVLILMRHMTQTQAESSVKALTAEYPDWNEVRVSQVQEIAGFLDAGSSKKKGVDLLKSLRPIATTLKTFLQEVFQETHGLDLAQFGEDPAAAGKLIAQMPLTGLVTGSFLLSYAAEGQLPVHTAFTRVLDRLGLMTRTSSVKKAREAMAPMIAPGDEAKFIGAFNEVADRYCDSRKPICHECPLVAHCKFGERVFKDWKVQQTKLAAQVKKDEERRKLAEQKDAERVARDLEREKKRVEAEAKKREREEVRKLAIKKKEMERRAAERKKETERKAAERKKEAERKAAEKKMVADKKKSATKGAVKKAPAKKTPAAKASHKKKPAAGKAASGGTKKAPAAAAKNKAAAKKAPAKKAPAKKAPAKKAPAKKVPAKKAPAKKAAAKKAPANKKAAKKGRSR